VCLSCCSRENSHTEVFKTSACDKLAKLLFKMYISQVDTIGTRVCALFDVHNKIVQGKSTRRMCDT